MRDLLILDACVLIDLIKADKTILRLVSSEIGQLHVTSSIAAEVHEVSSPSELEELGIIIVEQTIEDAFLSVQLSNRLSLQDKLCYLTAKRCGYICVTNDKILRKLCTQDGVPLLWGLELILQLHRKGCISIEHAINLVRRIKETNPMHFTAELVSDFIRKLHEKGTDA